MNYERNNLDRSASPYLRQHADNPVWWQEWNADALSYARENGRILLVSVGYSTCHWCHVMARETFSDTGCASVLNRSFLPIKVDREQRPDIDRYMMSFLVATTGSGGWPLNVFLTPDCRPFFAMTYGSIEPRFNMPGFADILDQVIGFYREKADLVEPFELVGEPSRISAATLAAIRGTTDETDAPVALISDEDEQQAVSLIDKLESGFDRVHGGFGSSQKFPPHSVLLYLQYAHAAGLDTRAGEMVAATLDAMMTRGLHDHLQGGFYRYTVDRDWTIPHFEKMLYDQAMLLWNYSLAARIWNRDGYRATAAGIVRALEETFRVEGGYASAHDADTDHREGATYLWRTDEVEQLLDPEELDAALRIFTLTKNGNFEGRNHLVRILRPGVHRDAPHEARRAPEPALVDRLMRRLLEARLSRRQPARDDKIILGWNALAGCGLLAAHRYAGISGALDRAEELASFLVTRFADHRAGRTSVGHALLGDHMQEQEFLGDVGALLLFLTMLAEERPELDRDYAATRDFLVGRLADLQRDGTWMESIPDDFTPVPAEPYDQPIPSGMALAEHALLLRQMARHEEYLPRSFGDGHGHGFANVSSLASRGYVYVVESPDHASWEVLPVNSYRIHGEGRTSCYRGVCYLGLPPGAAAGQR